MVQLFSWIRDPQRPIVTCGPPGREGRAGDAESGVKGIAGRAPTPKARFRVPLASPIGHDTTC